MIDVFAVLPMFNEQFSATRFAAALKAIPPHDTAVLRTHGIFPLPQEKSLIAGLFEVMQARREPAPIVIEIENTVHVRLDGIADER